MRVLILSAYGARSHRHWQQCLLALFSEWHWQVLELPPRHFSWRVRGNPLHWSIAERATLEQDYDLVLATSMVDLATLRGLVPRLADHRTLLYFHENQFAYPAGSAQASAVEAQMVSLYSALAADGLLFNSQFNQDTFLSGCESLLAKLPDFVPSGVVDQLLEKACVVPVPVAEPVAKASLNAWPGATREGHRPVRIAWLGRFEYDKGPDGLVHVLTALEEAGMDYELAVIGQQFRSLPEAFEAIVRDFKHRLVHIGFIDSEDVFLQMLAEVDVALSTALHEFQGLALIQAAAAGAIPVVPSRQAYPEVFPEEFLYSSARDNPEAEGRAAAGKILSLITDVGNKLIEAPDVSRYFRHSLRPVYAKILSGC